VEWLWEFCYGSPNYRTTSTYKSLSIKTTQYIFIVSGFEGGFNTAFSRRCIQAAMVQWFQKQTTNLFVERRGSIGGCVSGSYTLMHIGNLLRPSFLQTEQFLECFKKTLIHFRWYLYSTHTSSVQSGSRTCASVQLKFPPPKLPDRVAIKILCWETTLKTIGWI